MKHPTSKSLKRRLIAQLLLFQVGILLLFGVAFVAYLLQAGEGIVLSDPEFANVAAHAIERKADGDLVLNETEELAKLRQRSTDFWFVARSERGEIVQTGNVPVVYAVMAQHLDRLTFADIRDTQAPFSYLAVIRRVSGPAGDFIVLGKGDVFSMTYAILLLSNLLMVPILVLLVLITIIAIPWIVSRAFAGLSTIAKEAEAIDIDRRGYRLPQMGIPNEVVPLVNAINGALQRLDEGHERHQRFILDAAHELRTPVAILQTRVEGIADGPIRNRLLADAGRIAALAEQLLDLQRLDVSGANFSSVDMVDICRNVAADMAPLAIAQGYDLSLETSLDRVIIQGDAGALQRVIFNIVQNAIEHAGGKGNITIRIDRRAIVEITDEGPGIPATERDRIFEPFHRLHPHEHGAGLGLNLVKEIMQRHGGHVVVSDNPQGGARFRLCFPN
ncbi:MULTISPECIES: sensor histidine kinase [Rhizobium]|uniref:histidine kinase n=1 Tax=Rhizobium miluonense TaxID=411945 RepID=A0A1C3WT36_9HYPH|nr:HAMP domain-containing sensor histidine kinase [Rhizobium miluonense]SCB43212.1 Signal transduction histidine kinase [Rhizobium miluonense]